ncbi:alpha/beta fold hydrolase [Cupriavidus sp. DL-D2]|uniref:thioesterase II family protein n=1 Tax=Cupriavidus sp. DL-D2 TaxID=3144974 RepID=UPI00321393E1
MHDPVTLLCLPCAGASATMYLRWRRTLPAWVHVLPVELPGRGGRLAEDFCQDFDSLAAQLCDEQAPHLQGKYALFGHSMGALLAYGITRRLQAQGKPLPLALLLSGSPAPSQRDAERFACKDDDAGLIEDLRRQGGTPDEVFDSPELLRITLDVLGADYRICESFRHTTPAALPMPLHVLAGRQDPITAERIGAWQEEGQGTFTLDWFDGNHFFVRHQEAEVLDTVQRRLAQSLRAGAADAADADDTNDSAHVAA